MPDGSVYVLRRSARDSDGALVEMEFVLPGGCVAPPPHVHRHQVEQYEVIEGRFEVSQSFLRIRRGDPRGQLFLRYATTEARSRLGGLEDPSSPVATRRQWTLSSGLTFKAF